MSGNQGETTQPVFGRDGQVDYELLAVKDGGTVTKDFGYDAQGWVSSIWHFVDANGNRGKDANETVLSGVAYTHYKDASRKTEAYTNKSGQVTSRGTLTTP